MPPRPAPSRIAQALEYLQGLKSGVGEFVGGVGTNLADRAKAAGGLAYEALTSDPNIGRMTTAEFSEAAANRAPTPRLDQAAQDIGTIGKAILTRPVQTGKAIVRGEVDRAKEAMTSPQAAGQYAGSFIDPTRLAAALRHSAPIAELDVYHGTPHRFPGTEANPLGEFDASKIGTGEGAQAYGHGIYLAESPEVAEMYQRTTSKNAAMTSKPDTPEFLAEYAIKRWESPEKALKNLEMERNNFKTPLSNAERKQYDEALELLRRGEVTRGHRYKADLPDEMIDRMLDWDKPLSEQPAAVREALMKNPAVAAEVKRINAQREALNAQNPRRLTHPVISKLAKKETTAELLKGQALYELLAKGGNQAETSAYLRSLGIPGIRYLDAGSRDGGSGTRNFVVFPGEEKKVRILERNGQPAPERIAQALEAVSQGGKVVGIRSRQTAKMADRINETLGGGPQSLSDNVQREMKLATSVLQSKNPQAVEDWVQAYYNADLPMEQFEAATTNLRKTLSPETVDALIQNAGAFGTADQFKAFLNATPTERAKQLAKVSK